MKRAQPWPASAALAVAQPAPSPLLFKQPADSEAGATANVSQAGGGPRPAPEGTTNTWIPTSSGIQVDLLNPAPGMIRIRDIAAALAKLARWTGHTLSPYSVAQHSVHVSRLVDRHAAGYALLHDAHEAYIGDISSPVKAAIDALVGETWRDCDTARERVSQAGGRPRPAPEGPITILATRFDQAIFRAFGLPWPMPPHIAIAVKHADLTALATEKRDLLPHVPAHGEIALPPPDRQRIRPLSWDRAEEQFFARFRELFGEAFS